LHGEGGRSARLAVDGEEAVEGGQPAFDAAQPGAARGVGAAPAVVDDLAAQGAVLVPEVDAHGVRLGVLGGVGEGLGDREVHGGLHGRLGAAGQVGVDGDVGRAVHGEGAHRVGEAAVGEHRRVDAADQVAQFGQGGGGGLAGVGQDGADG